MSLAYQPFSISGHVPGVQSIAYVSFWKRPCLVATCLHSVFTIDLISGEANCIAGDPMAHGLKDGYGKNALFNKPVGIAVDSLSKCVFVADMRNHCVRKIVEHRNSYFVTTFCGSSQGYMDGDRREAEFDSPTHIAFDSLSGSMFVIDSGNQLIRKVLLNGYVSTYEGFLWNGSDMEPFHFYNFNGICINGKERYGLLSSSVDKKLVAFSLKSSLMFPVSVSDADNFQAIGTSDNGNFFIGDWNAESIFELRLGKSFLVGEGSFQIETLFRTEMKSKIPERQDRLLNLIVSAFEAVADPVGSDCIQRIHVGEPGFPRERFFFELLEFLDVALSIVNFSSHMSLCCVSIKNAISSLRGQLSGRVSPVKEFLACFEESMHVFLGSVDIQYRDAQLLLPAVAIWNTCRAKTLALMHEEGGSNRKCSLRAEDMNSLLDFINSSTGVLKKLGLGLCQLNALEYKNSDRVNCLEINCCSSKSRTFSEIVCTDFNERLEVCLQNAQYFGSCIMQIQEVALIMVQLDSYLECLNPLNEHFFLEREIGRTIVRPVLMKVFNHIQQWRSENKSASHHFEDLSESFHLLQDIVGFIQRDMTSMSYSKLREVVEMQYHEYEILTN